MLKRYPIKKMLKNPKLREDIIVGVIMFCQGHEGRIPSKEKAIKAYREIKEKSKRRKNKCQQSYS